MIYCENIVKILWSSISYKIYIKFEWSNVIPKWDPGDTVSSTQLIYAVRHVEDCGPGGDSQFSPTHYSSPHHLLWEFWSDSLSLSLSLKQERSPHRPQLSSPFTNKSPKFFFVFIFSLLISYTQFLSPTQIETLKAIPFLNTQTKMVVFS